MKLKRCPFCGGEARKREGFYDGLNEYITPWVHCTVCGCTMEATATYNCEDGWNRRNE